MTALPHRVERTVVIHARPATVFGYFSDSARWAAWWGQGSTISPQPGGAVTIRYPNGVEVTGTVLEIDPPSRIVFTYGYTSGAPIAPGESRVTITLAPVAAGTRLSLVHEFADASVRDQHEQGWRYQLSVFSNLVSDAACGDLEQLVDGWFAAWADTDEVSRRRRLASVASPEIEFRDRYSATSGLDDLQPHITATHRFMPGIRLERDGKPRHCQGLVLVDWLVRGADGGTHGAGTNVFVLDADGRVARVTGVWR